MRQAPLTDYFVCFATRHVQSRTPTREWNRKLFSIEGVASGRVATRVAVVLHYPFISPIGGWLEDITVTFSDFARGTRAALCF